MNEGKIIHPGFISDVISKKDNLGFDKYVNTLQMMLSEKGLETPFCIGINGDWGSGKSTFMSMMADTLRRSKNQPAIVPVWFNPWRYAKEEHLIIPFLKTIEAGIGRFEKEKRLTKKVKEGLQNMSAAASNAAAAFAYGMKADFKLGVASLTFDAAKAAGREEALAERRLKAAKTLSEELTSIYYDIYNYLEVTTDEKNFRIVVFIDDLDRCLPKKAVEMLEAIKLFLDLKGYVFVIGVARKVVEKGIAEYYSYLDREDKNEKETAARSIEYLSKMIQLPLDLPKVEPGRLRAFIESLFGSAERYAEHSDIIETAVGENPRKLKRFVNFIAFIAKAAELAKASLIAKEEEGTGH